MKTFYINQQTRDYELDSQNRFKMIDGDDAIMQGIWLNLTTNLGEYFFDEEKGLERGAIIGQKFNEERTIQLITDAILQHEMVDIVEDVTVKKEGRRLIVHYIARKIDETTLEGVALV